MSTAKETRFDGFRKTGPNAQVEEMIAQHCERHDIAPLEAVHLFPVLARRQNLKRFLAHSELFRMSLQVPGDIVELGVFRGLGLMTWANLLEAYCIGDRTKIVYGFDNWRGFTQLSPEDGPACPAVNKVVGGYDCSHFEKELQSVRNAIKVKHLNA